VAIEGVTSEGRKYVQSKEYLELRIGRLFTHLTVDQIKTIRGSSNAPFHYLGSAKMLGQIGKAFAEAMAEMESEQ